MIILDAVDLSTLESLHRSIQEQFPIPDITDPMYISCKAVVDNGKVQAIGLVKLTTEGVLVTDINLPKTTRALASVTAMNALKQDLISKGIHECHVFVQDEKVGKFLRHYGFKESKGGKPYIIFF
jgi:hypothetical protein